AATPPAWAKVPPATRSPFGITASARTSPSKPPANVDHALVAGSHAAMQPASWLLATVKVPATTVTGVSGPAPSGSHCSVAFTTPLVPATPPTDCHCVAHCAMQASIEASAAARTIPRNGRARSMGAFSMSKSTRPGRGTSVLPSGDERSRQHRQQRRGRDDAWVAALERVGVDERQVDHDLERVPALRLPLEVRERRRQRGVAQLDLDEEP